MTSAIRFNPMADASVIAADGVEHRAGLPILSFEDAASFDAWLAEEPRTSKGAWLKLAKKGSGLTSITRAEAVDAALCHGWIDGQQDRYDEASWLVRITPRKRNSRWSQINRTRVSVLVGMGLVRPAGLAEIEAAQGDGRWDGAYAPASTIQIPLDLAQALETRPEVAANFFALRSTDRYAVLYRLAHVKKDKTRTRLIGDLVVAVGTEATKTPGSAESPDACF